jgi:hypothetical protein
MLNGSELPANSQRSTLTWLLGVAVASASDMIHKPISSPSPCFAPYLARIPIPSSIRLLCIFPLSPSSLGYIIARWCFIISVILPYFLSYPSVPNKLCCLPCSPFGHLLPNTTPKEKSGDRKNLA